MKVHSVAICHRVSLYTLPSAQKTETGPDCGDLTANLRRSSHVPAWLSTAKHRGVCPHCRVSPLIFASLTTCPNPKMSRCPNTCTLSCMYKYILNPANNTGKKKKSQWVKSQLTYSVCKVALFQWLGLIAKLSPQQLRLSACIYKIMFHSMKLCNAGGGSTFTRATSLSAGLMLHSFNVAVQTLLAGCPWPYRSVNRRKPDGLLIVSGFKKTANEVSII